MSKFLWVDMEMTGLDLAKEVPIEIAAVVTDGPDFKVLGDYHAVIYQPESYIKSMDEWNQRTHKASGLVDLIPTGKPMAAVEEELIKFAASHYDPKDRMVLAGNSIFQDRIFLDKYFPKFAERLHYRMLDVTAFKVVFNSFYRVSYAKPESRHRAIDDIQQSINELKKYLSFVKL